MTTTAVTDIISQTTNTEASTVTDSIEEIISSAMNSSATETDKLQIIMSAIGNKLKASIPDLIMAIVVFFAGIVITRIILRIFGKCMSKANADMAATSFLKSLLKILLYIIDIIITLSILNIPMTSIIAVLSAAGLAVGLALQNSLSNLAGGFIILFSKPFKAGDFVETNSASGTVESINILYTKILTVDNKTVYIPNGKVADSQIVNYSEQNKRRVDMEFGISYSDDIERAKELILKLASEHELILNEPEPPFVRLGVQAEDSLQIIVRVWTATENYWQVKFDFVEMVNNAFAENHITIPFRQLDVHIS
ncbi:mechanosensitive ion channel family protein [Porcipelethomonas sp.]|uniref:mechanosensitive ion channel family protein n=1 Tax=Porcipelethomonas sp. TaxID=2981675 RepID=UPI003EF3D178